MSPKETILTDQEALDEPVGGFVRRDFVSVRPQWTISECLASLRGSQETGGIFYIYVTEDSGILKGVIPIRALLSADPSRKAEELMIGEMVTLAATASVDDAVKVFTEQKLLAVPVVSEDGKLQGIVDVNLFTNERTEVTKHEQADDIFQWIGVRVEVLKNASPLQAFRYRFPWLGATIGSGLACAALARLFEATLEEAVILAMFLTLALGLGESVSIQSMTMTMQALQGVDSLKDFVKSRLWSELQTAALLAVACGLIVGSISILWPGAMILSVSIGLSIAATIVFAGMVGLAVPTLLHKLKRDPRVAAGPITLAIADIATVFLYLGSGTIALYFSK